MHILQKMIWFLLVHDKIGLTDNGNFLVFRPSEFVPEESRSLLEQGYDV